MNSYFLIGIIMAGICLLGALALISARFHWALKVTGSAAMVALAIYAWTVSVAAFGYPVAGLPPDGSIVVDVDVDVRTQTIAFWVKTHDGNRAYVIPLDGELAKKLEKAQDDARRNNGKMIFHIEQPKELTLKRGDKNLAGMATDINAIQGHPPPVDITVVPSMPDKH